ncbi:MAG: OprO/OprP family phosphate-selective porin [Planctomycetales bacterium]|nr:OprO/OprP family phosphate-selective porin [Planctomycetales bacterium]
MIRDRIRGWTGTGLSAVIALAVSRGARAQEPPPAPAEPARPAPAARPQAPEFRPAEEADPAKAPDKAAELELSFKDGLRVGAKGLFDLHIGGRAVVHARAVDGGLAPSDTVSLRQMRLEAEGTYRERFGFKVQGDFAGAAGSLQDGYGEWLVLGKALAVRAGQWKVPVSLEELTSTRFIAFVERSIVNRLAPARDIGAALRGAVAGGALEYELGAWNGSGRNASDDGDQKDVAGRLALMPFRPLGEGPLRGLLLAASGSYGNQHEVLLTDVTSPTTGTRLFDWDAAATTPAPAVTSGALLDGPRARVGLEAAWSLGPLGLQGEFLWAKLSLMEQSAALGRVEATAIVWGWYAQATFFLTGEDATRGRPKVKRPFTESGGGPGAIEVAVRAAEWRMGDHPFRRAMASPENASPPPTNTSTDRVAEVAAGLNWWPTPWFRISVDYVFTQYQDRIRISTVPGRSERREDAVLARVQVDF